MDNLNDYNNIMINVDLQLAEIENNKNVIDKYDNYLNDKLSNLNNIN